MRSAATPPASGEKPHAVCLPFPTQGHITPMLKLAKILHRRGGFDVTFRQHRVQPPPPRPVPGRRRRGGPPGVPLRHHPGRPAGVRRRRRHHQLRHQAPLPASLQAPAARRRRARRRRGLRRGGQPDEFQRGRRDRARRPVRALLDRQRLRLHGLSQLPPSHRPRNHPAQRRRAADERVHGHASGLGARHEQAHAAQGHAELPPHHGPQRRPDDIPATRGRTLGGRVGRDHQQLRRAGAAGARRHARHHPLPVHHRPARVRRRPGRRRPRPRRNQLEHVEGRRRLPRVAGRQGAPDGGVRQLRKRDGDEWPGAGGVRVGPGRQRPRLPVDRQTGRGEGGCGHGGAAAGVRGDDAGEGPPGELVRPGGGAAARGGGAVPDAQRVELDAGEPMLCWPFFAEQQTNCRYKCAEWGVAMEVGGDVRREAVEAKIREAMGRDDMARRAAEWKEAAARATVETLANLDSLIADVLLPRTARVVVGRRLDSTPS